MGKLIKVRKPKIRISGKGLKVSSPSARIGGKAGLNISKKGVSASVRTPIGTIKSGKLSGSKKANKKSSCFGLLILTSLFLVLIFVLVF